MLFTPLKSENTAFNAFSLKSNGCAGLIDYGEYVKKINCVACGRVENSFSLIFIFCGACFGGKIR